MRQDRALLWLPLLAALLVGFTTLVRGDSFPQWRGPERDGSVPGFTPPSDWPDMLQSSWDVPVGEGHSCPIVLDDRIYLHTRESEQETVRCLSLATGDTLWQKSYPVVYAMNPAAKAHGKGPKSTPVLQDGRLYTLGITGILSCFNAQTGELHWQQDFSNEFPAVAPLYGTAMSPVVANGMVIAHIGGHDHGALIAFDAPTGEVRWRWDEDGPAYTSPIVAEFEGEQHVVTQSQRFCLALALDTGEERWRIPFTTPYDQNIVTPIFYDGMIIFSGLRQGTMAIRVTNQGDTWQTGLVWHNPDISMYMSSPVLKGNLLFGFEPEGSGRFFCLDARNGELLWQDEGHHGRNAALLQADAFVFGLTDESQLLVFQASADAPRIMAQYKVADTPTWAHPVLLGNRILVKDQTSLRLWYIE